MKYFISLHLILENETQKYASKENKTNNNNKRQQTVTPKTIKPNIKNQ